MGIPLCSDAITHARVHSVSRLMQLPPILSPPYYSSPPELGFGSAIASFSNVVEGLPPIPEGTQPNRSTSYSFTCRIERGV